MEKEIIPLEERTTVFICKGCGAKQKKKMVSEHGYLTAFICYECGCTNDIADISQPIVTVGMKKNIID